MVPSISLSETLTNNVDLSPTATRQGDLVTTITPGITFVEKGARVKIDGYLSVPISLYARTSGADNTNIPSANNNIYPSGRITGDVAVIQDFFHVQAQATVTQQYFSPFGAQPSDFSNAVNNRYRVQTYSVDPYIVGVLSDGGRYEVRNNNVWTVQNGAPAGVANSNYNEFLATLNNDQKYLGYRANYDYTAIHYSDDNNIRTSLGRVGPVWNVDPQVRLLADVGYETNDYTFTSSNGPIYGAGIEWNPTERTKAVALYEHRFFGASYLASLAHRTPLSEWSLQASRNITTYPQQLGTVPVGLDVAAFLNNLFLSSIPDPAARQNAVNQLIADRGLPSTLITPVNLYSQQISLQESQTATVSLIGARNTILIQIYNVKSQPITASGTVLPPVLAINNNNTQLGASVIWNTRLTSRLNLSTSITGYRTVGNDYVLGTKPYTHQGIAQVTLSTPIGQRTTAFVGARYQALSSNVATDYNEAAALLGVVYTYQ